MCTYVHANLKSSDMCAWVCLLMCIHLQKELKHAILGRSFHTHTNCCVFKFLCVQGMILVRPVAWAELPTELWSNVLKCLTHKEGKAVACTCQVCVCSFFHSFLCVLMQQREAVAFTCEVYMRCFLILAHA